MSEVEDKGSTEPSVEYTEVEQKAMDMGWKPESDFDSGESDKPFIEAGEYIRNDSFFSEIRKLKKANEQLQGSFDNLNEHHQKVAKVEYEKARQDLLEQKKEALDEGDHEAVVKIDDQIMKGDQEQAQVVTSATNEVFNTWVENNSWYTENSEMKDLADTLGVGYMQQHPDARLEDAYRHVETQIKKAYGERLDKEESGGAPQVLSGNNSSTNQSRKGKQFTAADLNADQQRVMKNLVSQGVLTEKQYIDELKAIGELG